MATYYARKAGNINAADVWATTPSGTASNLFSTFTNADVLVANSFTITVNVSATVAEVRNDTTGGATLGGTFTLSAGVTLTANIFSAYYANGSSCVAASVSSNIVGNVTIVTSGFASSLLNRAVIFTGTTGTALNITGNIITPIGLTNALIVDCQTSGGQLNITGNLLGNASSGNNAIAVGTAVSNTGTLTITGNVMAGNAVAINSNATNLPINVTGTVTGGNTGVFGISNFSTSTCTIVGSAVGGVGGAGVSNSSTGTIRVTRSVGNAFGPGNTAGLAAAVGAANAGLGVIEIEQLEYGTNGMSPTSGTGIRLKKASSNVAVFNYCDTAGAKTLIDATQNAAMPAATDVRLGVSYASGAQTGSCAVPAASSVAFGVPVNNTTGTALLTGAAVATAVWGATTRSITGGTVDTLTNPPTVPTVVQIRQEMDSNSTKLSNLDATVSSRLAATDYNAPTSAPTAASVASAVWGAATRSITGGTVDTLTNAPTVPTPSQIASQVRTELATELARVDVATSTRLAGSAYTAPSNSDIAAIKAKTDNLPASPAAVSDIPSANISAIKAKTDNLPASPAATGDIPSANISAIKAKTDLLNTDRLAQVSTVSTTGAQLAAALS